MAMPQVQVKELNRRYVLSDQQQSLRPRLNQLTENLVSDHLGPLLQEVGIRETEEVCIRHLYFDLSFPPSTSDAEHLANWRSKLTLALCNEIERNDSTRLVRYASRIDAHLDIAKSLIAGRHQRAWAWRMLGLVNEAPADGTRTRHELALGWMSGLCSDPHVISVMQQLAKQGLVGELLVHTQLGLDDLEQVARAALVQIDRARVSPIIARRASATPVVATVMHPAAIRIVEQARRHVRVLAREKVTPLLALWWLIEYEPGLLTRSADDLQDLLMSIAMIVNQEKIAATAEVQYHNSTDPDGPQDEESSPDSATPGKSVAAAPQESLSTSEYVPVARHTEPAGDSSDSASPRHEEPVAANAALREIASDIQPDSETGQSRIRPGLPLTESAPATSDVEAGQFTTSRLRSEYGGLLLLLNLVSHFDFVARLVESPESQQRALGWWLEQLALQLSGLPVDDIALAVFSGREPEEPAWCEREAPVTECEQALLDHCIDEVMVTLSSVLPTWDRRELVARVCARHATLEISPGWITVFFAHDQASTELRRAALDLNPDFVPWLGIVVRFEYE